MWMSMGMFPVAKCETCFSGDMEEKTYFLFFNSRQRIFGLGHSSCCWYREDGTVLFTYLFIFKEEKKIDIQVSGYVIHNIWNRQNRTKKNPPQEKVVIYFSGVVINFFGEVADFKWVRCSLYLQIQSPGSQRGEIEWDLILFCLLKKAETRGQCKEILIESYGFSSTGHRKNCRFWNKFRKE